MTEQPIQITEFDRDRLMGLIQKALLTDPRSRDFLIGLQQELERAKIVSSREVAQSVVTMNSTVVLVDLDTQEEETYTLVFPEDADISRGRLSILAPVGTGMLGYQVGDVFEWPVPAGTRRLLVRQILYQPEAAGDFHL